MYTLRCQSAIIISVFLFVSRFMCAAAAAAAARELQSYWHLTIKFYLYFYIYVRAERNEQLKELRKKEAMMAEFMAEFGANKQRELERISSLQSSIPALLESASKHLAILQQHGTKAVRTTGLFSLAFLSST